MTREAFDERQAKRLKSVEEMEPEPDELKKLNFKERVALQRAKEKGFCESRQLPKFNSGIGATGEENLGLRYAPEQISTPVTPQKPDFRMPLRKFVLSRICTVWLCSC